MNVKAKKELNTESRTTAEKVSLLLTCERTYKIVEIKKENINSDNMAM